ncbi:hypothetical protein CEXT_497501 [Caerostris extrusa]|uniref:Uncharacterized protein n=1 Tax=Caerostris extrusa TaxID=172846 RepID=A0AAV4QII4_CAEEX|nr:hypothetical protein CEXT_497501 [Caerostris extrusa]
MSSCQAAIRISSVNAEMGPDFLTPREEDPRLFYTKETRLVSLEKEVCAVEVTFYEETDNLILDKAFAAQCEGLEETEVKYLPESVISDLSKKKESFAKSLILIVWKLNWSMDPIGLI